MNMERVKPLLFVVVTLVAWWALGTAGYLVVKCIPGGEACPWRARSAQTVSVVPPVEASTSAGQQAAAQAPQNQQATSPQAADGKRSWWPAVTRHDWLVLLSLITALWVANAVVYPPDDGLTTR